MRDAASLPKIKRIIENMPAAGLAELFTHFIRVCMKKKVFGEKSVAGVAKTIEDQAKGVYVPPPNQSPMPRDRQGNMGVATQIATQIADKKP